MPLDPNIALQGQVANPFQSVGQATQAMSGLQQLANMRQQNQMMQADTQLLNQQASIGDQMQNERQTYTSAMQDPNAPFRNSDGTIDPQKFQVWGNSNIPLMNSQYGGEMLKHNEGINNFKTTIANMATKDHDVANATMSSWLNPDGSLAVKPLDMIKQLEQSRTQMTGVGKNFTDQAQDFIMQNKDNPQALAQGIAQFSRTTTPAVTQQGERRANTSFVNNGAATVPVSNTGDYGNAPGTQTGTGVANQIGPDQRESLIPNPVTGGWSVQQKNPNGQINGLTNPPSQGVYQMSPGDKEQLPALNDERNAARAAYNAAPLQHTNNKIVLDNVDSLLATGNTGNAWRNITSAFGLNPGSADKDGKFDPATAYDLVGKGLERSALQAAQSMGPQTNAGLSAQVAANGSTSYTPAAIKEIVKLNDAITTGAQSYQPGLERAISANSAKGVLAKKDFDAAWGANFDPQIFQMYNAIKANDTGEQAAIIKKLGGTDSPAYKKFMQKAANLQSLSNTGSLPPQK